MKLLLFVESELKLPLVVESEVEAAVVCRECELKLMLFVESVS